MRRPLVRQAVDDQAEGRQGSVDVLGLIQSVSCGSRLCDLLASCQVDQVQLSDLDGTVVQVFLLNRQDEDQVRPGGVLVHVRDRHGAVEVTRPHGIEDLLLAPDIGLGDLSNEDTSGLVLMHFQVVLFRVQQVADALVVDLDDGYLDKEFDVLVRVVDAIKDGPHHAGDHALVHLVLNVRALHRVRLPGGGLAVGEDRAIEAAQHRVDGGLGRGVVHLLLAAVGSVHTVEDERVVPARHVDARVVVRDLDADLTIVVPLHLVRRPKPAEDPDGLLMGAILSRRHGRALSGADSFAATLRRAPLPGRLWCR
mmetsp:Transcript_22786/g.77556  ORF Transcript_22786/g.77556 Transcript_22786/m.77556 type:complete len:310 (-) Transcript_22786:98-1027(-)